MKKITILLTSLLLLLSLTLSVSAAGSAKMSLKSNKSELSRGDKFTITVSLKNDQPVSNGGIVLSYDSAAFQLLGGDCKVKGATLGEVTSGHNGGVFLMAEDTVVSGTVFTISMQVKADAPFGEFSVSGNPSLQSKEGGSISCSLSGTKVTVICPHDFSTGTEIDEDEHEAVCSICGEKKEEDHVWDKGTVTKKPTCQSYGKKDVTCTVCGAQGEKSVSLLPHECDYVNLETEGHRYTCRKCGETDIEPHSYADVWDHNENEHYHACTECGYQRDKAAHTPGAAATETTNQTCTVCDRVLSMSLNHDHTFSNQWVTDEENHWFKCAECDATRDMAEHEYDNACDDECNVCGATRQPPHEMGDWGKDGANHWKSCSRCGEKQEMATHTPSEDALPVCTVCGQNLATDHKHRYEPVHSHVCACGEAYEGDTQFCKVCGTFPWWVLCIAEAVLFAGILIFLRMRKKGGYTEDEEEEEEDEEDEG